MSFKSIDVFVSTVESRRLREVLSASFEGSGSRCKGKSRVLTPSRTLDDHPFLDISLYDCPTSGFFLYFLKYFQLPWAFSTLCAVSNVAGSLMIAKLRCGTVPNCQTGQKFRVSIPYGTHFDVFVCVFFFVSLFFLLVCTFFSFAPSFRIPTFAVRSEISSKLRV